MKQNHDIFKILNDNNNIDISEYNAQNVVDVGDQQRPSDLSRPISFFSTFYLSKNKQNKTKTKQNNTDNNKTIITV